MWWKQHKWKFITVILTVAVLAGAFWYGGNAPGSRGWTVPSDKTSQSAWEEDEQSAAEPAQTKKPEEDLSAVSKSEEVENGNVQKPSSIADDTEKEPDKSAPQKNSESSAPKHSEHSQPSAPLEMEIDPETGKDQYRTDPVPEGKPLPVEPQDVTIGTTAHSCTISISCATILNNLDLCDPEKKELVPEDGWILEPMTVTFYEGESVFHVLQRICKQQKIHMEFEDTPMYNSAYIEGIHNLYEFDAGELSGWMYRVNGWFPNYGCSRYQLQDGDVVEWVYTCDLGEDVGRSVT